MAETTFGTDMQFSVYIRRLMTARTSSPLRDMKGMGPGHCSTGHRVFDGCYSVSLHIANNTWTYLYLATKYSDFSVAIIGFNGETGRTIEVPLASDNKVS